jgi:hypothetical protein
MIALLEASRRESVDAQHLARIVEALDVYVVAAC